MIVNNTIKVLVLSLVLLASISTLKSQPPVMEWHEGFGTDQGEHVHEGWQTSDKGFIGIGQNAESTGDCIGECGNILVIKVDSNAKQDWIVEIGVESEHDVGICVKETSDGFIIGGGFHNTATGYQERMLAKLDFDGNTVWKKSYLGEGHGAVRGIDINERGEIIATGYTKAAEDGFLFIADEAEGFLMKADSAGKLLWDKVLDAPQGTKVRIKEDGGYAVVSTKWVYTFDRDNQDVVLILADSLGNETFNNNYGAEKDDQCFDFDLAMDGGYILTGHTRSYDVINWDYLVMKIDGAGNEEWVRTFGQPRGYDPRWIHDESYGVRATPDGGYVVAGGSGDEYSYSFEGHPSGPSDEWKAYLVKIDADGNLLWEGLYPEQSVANNAAEYIALTHDGGYIVFTDTDSESPPGENNFGFMKIEPDTVTVSNFSELTVSINGKGTVYPMNKYQYKDSTISITAIPDKGWEFGGWGGDLSGSDKTLNITMESNKGITATFSESGTAIIKKKVNSTTIFPNPLTGEVLFIEFPESILKFDLELVDMAGRILYRKTFSNNGTGQLAVHLPALNDGLYILYLKSQNFTSLTKLIME